MHIHTQGFYRQMSGAHTALSFVAFAAVDVKLPGFRSLQFCGNNCQTLIEFSLF